MTPREREGQASRKAKVQYAIDIVGLTKSFRRHTLQRGSYTTIKSSLAQLFRKRGPKAGRTDAVQDLTMRVPQGASIGIIGRNGSGKSTLLKLITGIYKPTAGTVRVNGRVAALIELGAGFHPDFTGRENMMLAGIMMGLTRAEVQARFDEIVEFSGLAEVIDDPVRTYSSGMFMRLGFSVAVHTDPDVLLIDEVLAVGDAAFVRRCKERVSELRAAGKTLLLVSHDLEAVERWCDEVVWLHQGVVKDRGEPRRVIDHYREFLENGEEEELQEASREHSRAPSSSDRGTVTGADSEQRWGSREVEITEVQLLNRNNQPHLLFHSDEPLTVEIHYEVHDDRALEKPVDREVAQDIVFGVAFHRGDGLLVHGTNTEIEGTYLPALGAKGCIRYRIERLGWVEGSYSIDVAAHRFDGYPFDYRRAAAQFAIRSHGRQIGVTTPPATFVFGERVDGGRSKSEHSR